MTVLENNEILRESASFELKPLQRKMFSRKASRHFLSDRPYRKPTQVGGCKCTKVIGITLVKELGKTASVS